MSEIMNLWIHASISEATAIVLLLLSIIGCFFLNDLNV